MKIENIKIVNEGYVCCNSSFYSSQDGLSSHKEYYLTVGENRLIGEIDSGVWAVSYLLSMYKYRPKDFILFGESNVIVNNKVMHLKELLEHSCYMDTAYPLFSSKQTVKKLVLKGLAINKRKETEEEIRKLFGMDEERFERAISCVGNEIFRAMAAVGFCYGKQIFCFPWLSKKRFEAYHEHIVEVLNVLKSLNKIIVLPLGE